jgi:hypothetical protein
MHTVFDLVGVFKQRNRKNGESIITTHERVLHADMAPSQCAGGKTVLDYHAKLLAKPYIKPGEYWLYDWDLRERKLKDEDRAA